jgi:hypothetical protein
MIFFRITSFVNFVSQQSYDDFDPFEDHNLRGLLAKINSCGIHKKNCLSQKTKSFQLSYQFLSKRLSQRQTASLKRQKIWTTSSRKKIKRQLLIFREPQQNNR